MSLPPIDSMNQAINASSMSLRFGAVPATVVPSPVKHHRVSTEINPRVPNPQLQTTWTDATQTALVTRKVDLPLGDPVPGGVTVEMLYVPMHGSFWMSTHPDAIHPRRHEFLASGSFTFGNGGVGRVVATNHPPGPVGVGDLVAVFGHVPCDHHDCYACTVLHRYTECDYSQGRILGHGKGSDKGTFARYCHLPPHSYEVCYRGNDDIPVAKQRAMMYAFLVADVRNALTRHPDTLRNRRMLLFGAGMSGHLAAYIHSRTCPESQIVVVDPSADRLESVRSIAPEHIVTYQLADDVTNQLVAGENGREVRGRVLEVVADLQSTMRVHFGGRKCNLLFDASSGNTTPLWDNVDILSPTCHAIPFGFGSENIHLGKSLIQLSGLNLLMSRGVGNIRNRRETVEMINAGAWEIIDRLLIAPAIQVQGMDAAEALVQKYQQPPRPLHEIPPAILMPSEGVTTIASEGLSRLDACDQTGPIATANHPLRIDGMEITPIALADPPLLNAAGLHAAYALRIVVRLFGCGGQIGIAEVPGGSGTLAALRMIAPDVIGRDARQIRPMTEAVKKQFRESGHRDDRGNKPWDSRSLVHVLSALDVACLDLTARHYETRLCDLLGGAVRDEVSFAGYLFFKFAGDGGSLGAETLSGATGWAAGRGRVAMTPDDIVAQAAAMHGDFGFGSFKLKAGILDPNLETDAVLALRDFFGPAVPLRIDPNAVWSVPTALAMAKRMKNVLEYYEDPVRGQSAMAEVRRETGLKMATNMATTSFEQLPASIKIASEDVILSDHHYWGGLRPSLNLAQLCRTFGRGFSMHSNSHAGVSLAAMTHLAACIENVDYALDTHYPWQADDIITGGKLSIKNGRLRVPDGPGLGVTIDEAALRRAADAYNACGLTDRDDQVELQKHWSDWTFRATRY